MSDGFNGAEALDKRFSGGSYREEHMLPMVLADSGGEQASNKKTIMRANALNSSDGALKKITRCLIEEHSPYGIHTVIIKYIFNIGGLP